MHYAAYAVIRRSVVRREEASLISKAPRQGQAHQHPTHVRAAQVSILVCVSTRGFCGKRSMRQTIAV